MATRAPYSAPGVGAAANTGWNEQAGTVYQTADPASGVPAAAAQQAANAATARWVGIIILVALAYLVVLHFYFRRHLMA